MKHARALDNAMIEVAVTAEQRRQMVILAVLDDDRRSLTLITGNYSKIVVKLSWFKPTMQGLKPDFGAFSLIDNGHTLKFGEYVASSRYTIEAGTRF
jgi:hypothetical protein